MKLSITAKTNLFLIILCVVDKENTVFPSIRLSGLLKSNTHIHPALRLPVSPPAECTLTHPH